MAPPRTTVRNDQILAAIDALSRQVQSRDEPLEAWQSDVSTTLADVARRMDGLERSVGAALTKEAKRDACPFRDEIVAGANKERRLSAVEKGLEEARGTIHSIELKIAGWGVLGGGVISAIVAVVDKLIEAAQRGGA